MSSSVSAMLMDKIKTALFLFESADKKVMSSEASLHKAEERLCKWLDDAYETDDTTFTKLTEARSGKAIVHKLDLGEEEKAQALLDSACEDIKEYAIEICAPEIFRKTAVASYAPGANTVEVYFGGDENPSAGSAYYLYSIKEDSITHKREISSRPK